MRLTNFASIDPFHQERGVVGLKGGRKQCQPGVCKRPGGKGQNIGHEVNF
jgi:hypothetical protein